MPSREEAGENEDGAMAPIISLHASRGLLLESPGTIVDASLDRGSVLAFKKEKKQEGVRTSWGEAANPKIKE